MTAVDRLGFDDPHERLVLELGRGLLLTQGLRSPHIFIAVRDLLMSTVSGSLVRPPWVSAPVAALTTTAGTFQMVFACLAGPLGHVACNQFLSAIPIFVEDTLNVLCVDGAKANV